jgi:hypothetical protein
MISERGLSLPEGVRSDTEKEACHPDASPKIHNEAPALRVVSVPSGSASDVIVFNRF